MQQQQYVYICVCIIIKGGKESYIAYGYLSSPPVSLERYNA